MEMMKDDPEYRHLLQKQAKPHEDDQLGAVTTEELEEMRGRVKKAIHTIQQKIAREREDVSNRLNMTMMKMLINEIEVAEVSSPPRVAQMARRMGLKAGWSLDLTTCDSDGKAWDFNDVNMRNRAVRKVLTDEPLLLIGSFMCTAFSSMNRINYSRMSDEEVKQRVEHGRKHSKFCSQLYTMQWKAGRYFLHEHFECASPWEEQCIKDLLRKDGVMRVDADQCMYGLKSYDGERTGPARKGTGFLTNSVCIADQLRRRCPNRKGQQVHRHVILENGRTRAAQVYPDGLCKAICQGFKAQIQMDQKGQFLLMNVSVEVGESSQDLLKSAEKIKRKYRIVEEENDDQIETAWDDVSGAEFDPQMVKNARKEEIEYVRKMHFYDKVHIA